MAHGSLAGALGPPRGGDGGGWVVRAAIASAARDGGGVGSASQRRVRQYDNVDEISFVVLLDSPLLRSGISPLCCFAVSGPR